MADLLAVALAFVRCVMEQSPGHGHFVFSPKRRSGTSTILADLFWACNRDLGCNVLYEHRFEDDADSVARLNSRAPENERRLLVETELSCEGAEWTVRIIDRDDVFEVDVYTNIEAAREASSSI